MSDIFPVTEEIQRVINACYESGFEDGKAGNNPRVYTTDIEYKETYLRGYGKGYEVFVADTLTGAELWKQPCSSCSHATSEHASFTPHRCRQWDCQCKGFRLSKAEVAEPEITQTVQNPVKYISPNLPTKEEIRTIFDIPAVVDIEAIMASNAKVNEQVSEAMGIFTEKFVENELPLKVEVRTVSDTGAEKGVKPQRYDLIPIGPLAKLAELYGNGAAKYAAHNWRGGYEWSKSYAAAMRHITEFWDGADLDEEMQIPHVINAVFHLFALCEYLLNPERYGRFDDRYKVEASGYAYGVEDIELKFPTGNEDEELAQKIAAVIWEDDNHYSDTDWEVAWSLRDHDSFTEQSTHVRRVYDTALKLVKEGWLDISE